MTGPVPGTDLRWEALAYPTTPLPVIAACSQAMAELASADVPVAHARHHVSGPAPRTAKGAAAASAAHGR